MYYFPLTVFLALVVFFGLLPATVRRIRAQREALRPIQPVTRSEHLPCIVNTIGAAITEFFLLGLLTLAVFIASNIAFGTLGQAPDLTTGIRHLSLMTVAVIAALTVTTGLILVGGAFARYAALFLSALGVVIWMVMSTAGDQWPAILLFAFFAVGVPAILVLLLRRLF